MDLLLWNFWHGEGWPDFVGAYLAYSGPGMSLIFCHQASCGMHSKSCLGTSCARVRSIFVKIYICLKVELDDNHG